MSAHESSTPQIQAQLQRAQVEIVALSNLVSETRIELEVFKTLQWAVTASLLEQNKNTVDFIVKNLSELRNRDGDDDFSKRLKKEIEFIIENLKKIR